MAERKDDIDEILEASEPPAPLPPETPEPSDPPVVVKRRGGRWKLWLIVLLLGAAGAVG